MNALGWYSKEEVQEREKRIAELEEKLQALNEINHNLRGQLNLLSDMLNDLKEERNEFKQLLLKQVGVIQSSVEVPRTETRPVPAKQTFQTIRTVLERHYTDQEAKAVAEGKLEPTITLNEEQIKENFGKEQ